MKPEVQAHFDELLKKAIERDKLSRIDAIMAQRVKLKNFDQDAIWDLLYDARKIYSNIWYEDYNQPDVTIEDVTPREFSRVMDGLMILAEGYLGMKEGE